MRSGPNQYWSTVEIFGSDRLEALRGTHGVIFGADAVGGIVNSLSKEPYYSNQRNNRSFKVLGRVSSAEHSFSAGISGIFPLQNGFLKFLIWSVLLAIFMEEKKLGDKKILATTIGPKHSVSRKLSDNANLIIGIQKNFMDDVPRTHKTIDG